MNTRKHFIAIALAGLFAAAAQAGTSVDKVTVTPATGAKVGDKVKVTVEVSGVEGICGLEVKYGDGSDDSVQVESSTPNPIVFEHAYKKAGTYKIRAKGERVKSALSCIGKKSIEGYKVEAAKPVDKAAGPCPDGWTLKGKAAKDGAFSCMVKKGVKDAKKPEKPLDCPAGTSYFTKGKEFGCEKS